MLDAIIIGGSYAGLAAGLQLARARRSIAVIDAGERRNRFASEAHGFLGHDGRAPGDIAADGKRQLMAYPTVRWIDGRAGDAKALAEGFAVTLGDGTTLEAKRLILAYGVTDTLPDVDGIVERWGKHVFHCPYCHGYETGGGPNGVLAVGEMSMHQALMLPDWGPVTFFINRTFELTGEQREQLKARGTTIEEAPVVRISGGADVELSDGRTISLKGIFTAPHTAPSCQLAETLGCRMDETPSGPYIAADDMRATSVRGVFAAGDASRPIGSLTAAVADGVMAGMATHRSLMFGLGQAA
jgi:thioredoxin reductase